jgi:hypothetical protein
MEEKIISITYNTDKLASQAAELSKKIEETKTQLKELDKSSPDFAKATAQLKVYQSEQSNINKQLQANIVLNKQDGKSVYELQQANKALTAQYDNLTQAERENEAVGGELQKSIEAISNQLKGLEGATGRSGRNVGNYRESLEGVTVTITDLRSELKRLETEAEGLDIGSEEFKANRKAIDDTSLSLMKATGKVDEFGEKMAKNPAKEELNTLGDVAIGVTASLELMNLEGDKNSATAELQAKATKALAAAALLRNIQIGFGSVMDAKDIVVKKAATAAEYARTIAVNGAAAAQRVLNLVMSLNPIGLIVTAIGLAVVAFTELTGKSKVFSAIFQALTLQFQIAWKLLKPLLQSMGIIDTEAQAAAKKREAEYSKQAENLDKVGKKYKDQADLLKALGGDEAKVRALQRKQLEEQLAVLQRVANYTEDKTQEQIEADKEKYADQIQALKLFDAESIKIKNDALVAEQKKREDETAKQVAENKKRVEAEKKHQQELKTARDAANLKAKQDRLNVQIATIDQILAIEKQGTEKQYQLQEDRLAKEKQLAILGAKGDKAALLLIDVQFNTKLLEMHKARIIAENQISEETQMATINSMITNAQKGSEKELNLQKAKIDLELGLQTDKIQQEIFNEELKQAKLAEINAKANADKEALDATYAESQKAKGKTEIDNKKQVEDAKLQAISDATDKAAQIASQVNNLLATIDEVTKAKELKDAGNNAKKKEEIEKKYFEKAKQRQITQIAIDTIAGSIKAYMGALAFDPTTTTSTILAALVAAQGAASIALVASQKFAYGGIVQGSGHGDTVPAMLTPGEMVMRKDAVAKYGGTLSAINESVGGKGIGNFAAASITPSGNNSDIVSAIKQIRQPVTTVRDIRFGLQDNTVTTKRTTL